MPRKSKSEQPFDKSKYDREYQKQHYKRIPLDLKFDFYNELLDHALETGEPVNAFIRRAIEETIQRDKDKRYKL